MPDARLGQGEMQKCENARGGWQVVVRNSGAFKGASDLFLWANALNDPTPIATEIFQIKTHH